AGHLPAQHPDAAPDPPGSSSRAASAHTASAHTASAHTASPHTASPRAASARSARLRSAPATGRPGLYREKIAAGRGYVCFGVRAPGVGDLDAAAVRVLAGLLGGGTGTRLARALAGPTGEALGMEVAPDLILGPSPSLGPGADALAVLTPAVVQQAARRWLASDPIVTISSPAAPEGTNPATAGPLPPPGQSPAASGGDLVIAG